MQDKIGRQAKPTTTTRIRTVVVEDSSVAREAMANLLETHPLIECVGMGCDGHEGFKLIGQHQPDLVLVDMEMPGLNGLALVEKLRKKFPAMRLVVISTHEGCVWQQLSQTRGADAFVAKRRLHEEFAELVGRLFSNATTSAAAAGDGEVAHAKAD